MSALPWKRPARCPPMNKDSESIHAQALEAALSTLKHIHKSEDVQSIGREIAFRFGSANAMFAADRYIWEQLGLRANDALLMSRLCEISRYADQSFYSRHPRLDTVQRALNYLIASCRSLPVERFYMLCLDKRGCMKEKVFLYEGTADCTLLNLHKMMREAVRISPAAVILSHNHPGCTMHASPEDISSTQEAMRALSAIGITMLDHLIVAGNRGVSMRMSGYIPEKDWLAQQPGNRLLSAWMDMAED